MTTKLNKLVLSHALSVLLFGAVAGTANAQDKFDYESYLVDEGIQTSGLILDKHSAGKQQLLKHFFLADREQFPNGVAHYQFDVRVGPGEYDVVRIHRVVRERRPYRPVRTNGAVFMTHGASLNFDAIYLRAGDEDPDSSSSIALYLADNDIDVWGMDFGWTQVPADAMDFSFMEGWGVERDARHTLSAMRIARWLRGLTGQGFRRMNLLGYSYGVGVIYAAAGRETQQRRFYRDIRGLIAVDGAMKYSDDNNASRLDTCDDAAGIAADLDAGLFADNGGAGAGFLSLQATTAPDDASLAFPGLTNYQAPLFFGAHFHLFGPPRAPDWHFVAGDFAFDEVPTGLLYSDPDRWIRFLGTLSPFMPNLARYETAAVICDEDEVSIDNHLAEISVPILYVGAAGAFGDYGDHTASETASTDVTNYTVQLLDGSDDSRVFDYGHADLFLGEDADALAWEEIRQWLIDH